MLLYKKQFFNRRYSALPFSTYQLEIADCQALPTFERENALNEPAISKPCGGDLVLEGGIPLRLSLTTRQNFTPAGSKPIGDSHPQNKRRTGRWKLGVAYEMRLPSLA